MTTGYHSDMVSCFKHAVTLPCFHSKTNQLEMNSHPHLNGNSVEGLPAVVSQAWVKICFQYAVCSGYDVPQGVTWRWRFGFLLMIDAAAHSSEPQSFKWRPTSHQEFQSSRIFVKNISLSLNCKRNKAWSNTFSVSLSRSNINTSIQGKLLEVLYSFVLAVEPTRFRF